MKLLLTTTLLILLSHSSEGQEIDTKRLANWAHSGTSHNIENTSHYINILDSGLKNDGVTENGAIFNSILQSGKPHTTYYFPEGTYLFEKSILLTSDISIIGEGNGTQFVFNNPDKGHGFVLRGESSTGHTIITSSISKGNSIFTIKNDSNLSSSSFIKLIDDDSRLITSTWAAHQTGQIARIASIDKNEVTLANEIRRNYSSSDHPRFKTITPIKNIEISQIAIHRNDSSEHMSSSIYFQNAYNCKISCIESFNSQFAHIGINSSLNIEVTGSFFKDGQTYGGGGRAYGVVLQMASSQCLITNNIFEHLRHSILLQAGANGNVISYNYSSDAYWSGTSLPADAAGDIVLHGNYVYSNLIEGNVTQNIVIDNSHGKNGPNNVFLRNTATNYGIFMNSGQSSDSQVFVGNIVTNKGFFKGLYSLAGNGHFEYGNLIKGTITPRNTNKPTVKTLYLADNNKKGYHNTAKNRKNNLPKTACSFKPSVGIPNTTNSPFVSISPNPVHDILTIKTRVIPKKVEISNAMGQTALTLYNTNTIPVTQFPPGVYYLSIETSNQKITKKFLVH